MNQLPELKRDVMLDSDPKKAAVFRRFFKTAKGEYGYGDEFVGLTVPKSRLIAAKYNNLKLPDIQKLLHSKVHEERLIALLILVYQFQKGNSSVKKAIYNFYLKNIKNINNWDLVDISADKIIGSYLYTLKDFRLLYDLAVSDSLWKRRIAIIATFYFIKQSDYKITLEIAEKLLFDKEDLIHKAVGWMLREVGNKCSREAEESFLKDNYKKMPRTMLRYAIEKFPENKRQLYLKGLI